MSTPQETQAQRRLLRRKVHTKFGQDFRNELRKCVNNASPKKSPIKRERRPSLPSQTEPPLNDDEIPHVKFILKPHRHHHYSQGSSLVHNAKATIAEMDLGEEIILLSDEACGGSDSDSHGFNFDELRHGNNWDARTPKLFESSSSSFEDDAFAAAAARLENLQ